MWLRGDGTHPTVLHFPPIPLNVFDICFEDGIWGLGYTSNSVATDAQLEPKIRGDVCLIGTSFQLHHLFVFLKTDCYNIICYNPLIK